MWLLAAIACEISATLSLRASDGFRRRRWLVPVVAGYLASIVLLALSLRAGMMVGVAYGIWAATGIAAVALLARVIWDDPLTRRMVAGIVLIAVGVLLVELG
ncbi:SMR family transporter [Georgenia halophila]|uniref:SMR family transporter n=1 Tax=Georgenia halophila TaxID=620889 RepID=A0ABP8LK10_9MICO